MADWEAMLKEYGPQRGAEPPPFFEDDILCSVCGQRPGDRYYPVDSGRWVCGGCWAAQRGRDEEDPWIGWRVDMRDPYLSVIAWVEGWVARPGETRVEELLGYALVDRLAGPGTPGFEVTLGGRTLDEVWPVFHAGVATPDEAITLAKRALTRHHHRRDVALPLVERPAREG